MKISTRLTIALLVAALLPLIIVGLWSLWTLQRANQLGIELSEEALTNLGQEAIRQRAESVAREVELYLVTHPEIDLANTAQLEANADLAEIAVQFYGEEGYTAVYDDQAITHFHPSSSLIGANLREKVSSFPDFLQLIEASLDGTPTEGYYDWPVDSNNPGGAVRRKYMSIVPVGDTSLRVASTTYMDEFSRPAEQVKERLGNIRNSAHLQLLAILIVVALATVLGAYLLGRRFSQPISLMTDAAVQIAAGDLGVEPPSSELGELGQLAGAFRQMTGSLHALIRQVRTMALNLGSSAGEVMMTQRQHAANAGEQAAAVANASAAVEELATSSAHIAETSQQVVAAANQTQGNAQQGVKSMAEAARSLQGISEGNQASVARVRELGNLAREIGAVMDLIEDIAAQTRLIAFNASIEASAAGEAGRRFAVVASEVRRLAGSVAQSTEEIQARVEEIQATTNELIIASEREGKEIESGLAIGATMTDLLNRIYHSAEQTTLAVAQISLSTQQQRTATEQLADDLQPLTTGASTVAAGSKQTVTVMEDLVAMADELQRAVARFRLPEEAQNQADDAE